MVRCGQWSIWNNWTSGWKPHTSKWRIFRPWETCWKQMVKVDLLLHNSHSQSSPAVPQISGRQSFLPIHLPPIRPVLCPMDIHQGDETTNDPAQVMGYQDNSLYRRHVDTGWFPGRGNTTPWNTDVSAESSGVHDQSREISPVPLLGYRVPGVEVDLFASQLTHQLPRFFSWRPDPQAEAVDAFQQDWGQLKGYANPPWCLVGRVLNKVRSQEAQLILVAPVWKGQSWYPVLLGMLRDFSQPPLITAGGGDSREQWSSHPGWPVTGRNLETDAFQQMLQTSCWHPGGRSPHKPMTPYSTNGLAGILNGIVIPFLAL